MISRLRAQLGSRATLGDDTRAGFVLGVVSVPGGLAAGLLAGVSPVFGLFGYLVGTVVGSVSTSSALMIVQATAAMAVIIADVPQVGDLGTQGQALATLALLTGLVLLVGALLDAEKVVRFISNAVLVGFVNAIGATIILGQIDNLTGYDNSGANRLLEVVDSARHIGSFQWATVVVGLATIALIVLLERTPLKSLALVVAVAATSGAVAIFSVDSVATVADIASVPRTLPLPSFPDLGLAPALIVPALSLALVVAVQGAAIGATTPNPDGRRPRARGDLRGQALANLACGVTGAMPVGGSVSATAIARAAGSRTRLTGILAGVVMAVCLAAAPGLIGGVTMASLGGFLMVVGWKSLRIAAAREVWRTGRSQAIAMVATFVLTLLIPLQYAVLAGVGVAMLSHIVRQADRIQVHRWVVDEDGHTVEIEPPMELAARDVVVLVVAGSLFFGSASTFEALLPTVTEQSRRSTVILRLRGQDGIGGVALASIRRYAEQLHAADCRLVLVGVGPELRRQLATTGTDTAPGVAGIHDAGPRIGGGITAATREAEAFADGDPGDGDQAR